MTPLTPKEEQANAHRVALQIVYEVEQGGHRAGKISALDEQLARALLSLKGKLEAAEVKAAKVFANHQEWIAAGMKAGFVFSHKPGGVEMEYNPELNATLAELSRQSDADDLRTAQDEAWANWNSFQRVSAELTEARTRIQAFEIFCRDICEVTATAPEDVDTSGASLPVLQIKQWSLDSANLAEARRQLKIAVDAIEDAPHAVECKSNYYVQFNEDSPRIFQPCNCFKSVLARIAEPAPQTEGNKS